MFWLKLNLSNYSHNQSSVNKYMKLKLTFQQLVYIFSRKIQTNFLRLVHYEEQQIVLDIPVKIIDFISEWLKKFSSPLLNFTKIIYAGLIF